MSEKITTYDPVNEGALIDCGDDGDYTRVEHFDRVVKALCEIDEAFKAERVEALDAYLVIERVLERERGFLKANSLGLSKGKD